jgi:hypothetical protein
MTDTRATLTASALLDAVVGYYETNGVALPDRQLVALGLPAWDCEQLTVSIDRIYGHGGDVNIEQPTALHAHPAFSMRAAVFSILLLRCVPVSDDDGTPPDADAENAAALAVYADQQLVENAVIASYNAGELASCNGLTVVEWLSQTPAGGLGGGLTRVRLALL